ncbi:MATE family efflux transporter [Nocardioides mangrovicus]|uniref:MATE family efflux transporter n=1 Tax=Nocardioides mangrovicus TaxID=2478913 RepID=UPI001E4CE56C|nr:MATE family efflux transporter [Nocardioides mangrovicus]
MSQPEAPTTRRLLALSASAFVVLAAEPLYLLVDTAVVGHLGRISLGGLGVGAAVMGLLTVVGTFVEYGTTSRAARWFGAGQTERAVGEGVQASWLALGIGLVIVVIGEIFVGPLTAALAGGAGPTQRAAESWLRIALVGLPGILLVLAGNGWMRGVQRTREPVVLVLAANAVSAVLSPVLVYPVGLGLAGSAWANLAAQVLGAVLFLTSLRRAAPSLRPDLGVMRRQLVVGRDLIIRSVAFQIAFLSAAGVASRMGTAQIAAHQIGLQLWEFTALLLDSFAIAAQSLVGAALGGADAAYARTLAWQVGRWGLYAGLGFAVLYAAGWSLVPRAFTSDAGVQHQAHLLWWWFVAMLPAAGLVFALDGVLLGAGDVGFMAWLTVVAGVVAFAPLNLLALRLGWGIGGVWAGLAAFVLVRLVGMVWRVRGTRWSVEGVVG